MKPIKSIFNFSLFFLFLISNSAQAVGVYTRLGCTGGGPNGSFQFSGEVIETATGLSLNGLLHARYGFYQEDFLCTGSTIENTVCKGSWGNENHAEVRFTLSQDQKIGVIFNTPDPADGYLDRNHCQLF